jgi:hypothetical protein
MQSLNYDRDHLSASLGKPLRQMVEDSLSYHKGSQVSDYSSVEVQHNNSLFNLQVQIRELKDMVEHLVKARGPEDRRPQRSVKGTDSYPTKLEGVWVNRESRSYFYAQVVDGQLLVPYCYGGNDRLKAVYYGWRKEGVYWFARFKWIDRDTAGFVFFREKSQMVLTGAWWGSGSFEDVPSAPPDKSGVPVR